MLLAADVGNTEIVLGVFRGAELAHTWRISTQAERTADELALLLLRLPRRRPTCRSSRRSPGWSSRPWCPT